MRQSFLRNLSSLQHLRCPMTPHPPLYMCEVVRVLLVAGGPVKRVPSGIRHSAKCYTAPPSQASHAKQTFSDHVQQLADAGASGHFSRHRISATPGCTVLLLHPPGACSAFTRSGSQYPPLGLLMLKALVNDTNLVDVIEADGNGWTDEATAQVRFSTFEC
jgi:hypothetical protein